MTLPRCALRHQSESQLARTPTITVSLADDARGHRRRCVSDHLSCGARAERVDLPAPSPMPPARPILAAQVSIPGTRLAAATDNANGRFHLTGLTDPVGTAVTLVARRIGYSSADRAGARWR